MDWNWSTFLQILTATGISIAGLTGFLVWWVKVRLGEFIKLENSKALEVYKLELSQRQDAKRVAEFLAEQFCGDDESRRRTQLAWELTFSLPSELVCELTRTCVGVPGAKDVKGIIVEVRKHLGRDDGLEPGNLLHFLHIEPVPESRR